MAVIRVKCNSWLAKMACWYMGTRQVGLVVGHTIYLSGVSKEQFLSKPAWVRHEVQHVLQYERMGTVYFLLRYFWLSLRFGYYNNPLEKEARDAELLPLPQGYQLL